MYDEPSAISYQFNVIWGMFINTLTNELEECNGAVVIKSSMIELLEAVVAVLVMCFLKNFKLLPTIVVVVVVVVDIVFKFTI